jgi:hypothetical protein
MLSDVDVDVDGLGGEGHVLPQYQTHMDKLPMSVVTFIVCANMQQVYTTVGLVEFQASGLSLYHTV